MVPGENKERKILQLNLYLYRSDDELHKGYSVMITTAGAAAWCWLAHCFYPHPLCGDGGIRRNLESYVFR